ncbi:MAG: T9SS type A sorting domain-containing protein [Bacteroidia bacterium]|nr:T9SS type A sorting domain-containing protein [Bacteroidia bacterium]
MYSSFKNYFFRIVFVFIALNFSASFCQGNTGGCENDSTIVHLFTRNNSGDVSHSITISLFDRDSGIVQNCQQQQAVNSVWSNTICQTDFWERTDTVENANGDVIELITSRGSTIGWTNKLSRTFNYTISGKLSQETSRIWNGSSWDSTNYKSYGYDSQDQLILTQSFTINSGIWNKINLVEINYLSGQIQSKRYASGNAMNSWENDSLFNFNYSGSIRSSAQLSYWDTINSSWLFYGLLNYSMLSNDWSIHIDKTNSKLLNGNLVYDSLAYEIDSSENIVFTFNKIFTLAHPAPSDYYEFYTYSEDKDKVDNAYITKRTVSGDFFMVISTPGDTMIADFSRDVVNELFYNTTLQLTGTEYHGGCTNPCGGDSQYLYDSTGFLTNYNHYRWTMVSDDYYYDSYSHYNNSTPTIIIPEWEKNIATCDSSAYQPNLVIAGGCAPYHIQWFPATGLSSDTILNPSIFITDTVEYTILLTDNNGISDTATFSVLPLITSAELLVDSSGCPGSVTLTLPYNLNNSYAWYKDNLRIVLPDTNQIVVTDAGEYFAISYASHGSQYSNSVYCSMRSDTFRITIPTAIRHFEEIDLCNGSAYILPDGNIVELAGTYISNLVNSAGCDSIIETIVHVIDLPVMTTAIDPILCYGDSAEITVSASGGMLPYNGTGTYKYPAGTFVITVTDSIGCKDIDTLSITEPSELIADAGTPLYLCTAGQVLLGGTPTAYGGTGNLQYLWTPGALLISDIDSNPIAAVSLSTIYHVVATDANGCTAFSDVLIEISDLIEPVITRNGNMLYANSNAHNYEWFYNGILILSGNFPSINATQDGDYGVRVYDNEGCNLTSSLFTYLLNSTHSVSQNSTFSIFPNPANEIFYIEQKAATSQSTLRIFDITGKIILTAPLTETIMKIDISKLPGGLYTISVSNEATIFYDQLIIGK